MPPISPQRTIGYATRESDIRSDYFGRGRTERSGAISFQLTSRFNRPRSAGPFQSLPTKKRELLGVIFSDLFVTHLPDSSIDNIVSDHPAHDDAELRSVYSIVEAGANCGRG